MNKKIIFGIILAVLLIIPLILAEESISKTSFLIKIYNNSLEITSNEYSGNNQIFSFNILNMTTNSTNSLYVPLTEFNYSFLFVRNVTVSMDLVKDYTDCLSNTTQYQVNLTQYSTQKEAELQQKNNEISSKQSQIDTLTKEKQDTSNRIYLVGFVCLVLGVLGTLFYFGKIGRKTKDKTEDEFHRGMAG